MAAKPKMTPEQWASTRATWEADPRDGYAWLVEALALPVSSPGVRKTAMRDDEFVERKGARNGKSTVYFRHSREGGVFSVL